MTITFCPLIFGLGFWELVVIAIVLLLLFGGKKIPEMMRGMGKGIKNFKAGLKETDEESSTRDIEQ